jgi:hypothetical protein
MDDRRLSTGTARPASKPLNDTLKLPNVGGAGEALLIRLQFTQDVGQTIAEEFFSLEESPGSTGQGAR